MYKYPNWLQALESAREVRKQIRNIRRGVAAGPLLNNLWTLQGFATYYALGDPRYRAAVENQESKTAEMGPVPDEEFENLVGELIDHGDSGGDEHSFLALPFVRQNWKKIAVWCMRAIAAIVAVEIIEDVMRDPDPSKGESQ